MEGGAVLATLDLHDHVHLFKAYTELRMQENREVRIVLAKGNNTVNSRMATSGLSARVYANGSWGFASNPELTADAAGSVIRAATDNAMFLDAKVPQGRGPLPVVSSASDNDFSTAKPRLSQRELGDFVREVDEHLVRTYPRLASRTLSLYCLDMEKTLLTSDGSYAHSMIPRSTIGVSLSLETADGPVELSRTYGGFGQFEDVLTSPASMYAEMDEQYQHLARKAEGVFADAGAKTCVLDGDMVGLLAHEAIGHTTEADAVLNGSIASQYLNKEVASPLVTLVDCANTCMGRTLPVPVYIDDEGTRAEDAVIIDHGILRGYLHSKESASLLGFAPTGNARAFTFSDEPLIRMRNTAILPGTSSLAEIIESIDDGYYLVKSSNGQADFTSEFMFGITLGYEIKNGKLGRAIRDTTISGVAFDLLKTVSMVSSEMKWSRASWCGKKQQITVGMGGAALKCRVNIGGR